MVGHGGSASVRRVWINHGPPGVEKTLCTVYQASTGTREINAAAAGTPPPPGGASGGGVFDSRPLEGGG